MFKHLLVPLDGSRAAEAAVTAAVSLAEKTQAAITLLHLIEPNPPDSVHGDRHLRTRDEAATYLTDLARRLIPSAIKTTCHVHDETTRNVAQGIVAHRQESDPDLVVMCDHGHRRLMDVFFGRIAEQVIACRELPVLLVRPAQPTDDTPPCIRWQAILFPHDGNPMHEQALKPAMELAQLYQASLRLLMVIPTPGSLAGTDTDTFLPGTSRELLGITLTQAEQHLHQHVTELRAAGLSAVAEIRQGKPADVILDTAREMGSDLIVIGTHGKSGTGAFWAGSVAAKVLMHTPASVLLIPV